VPRLLHDERKHRQPVGDRLALFSAECAAKDADHGDAMDAHRRRGSEHLAKGGARRAPVDRELDRGLASKHLAALCDQGGVEPGRGVHLHHLLLRRRRRMEPLLNGHAERGRVGWVGVDGWGVPGCEARLGEEAGRLPHPGRAVDRNGLEVGQLRPGGRGPRKRVGTAVDHGDVEERKEDQRDDDRDAADNATTARPHAGHRPDRDRRERYEREDDARTSNRAEGRDLGR
jgi:hypothetical protein